jgi:hypothetical protein
MDYGNSTAAAGRLTDYIDVSVGSKERRVRRLQARAHRYALNTPSVRQIIPPEIRFRLNRCLLSAP